MNSKKYGKHTTFHVKPRREYLSHPLIRYEAFSHVLEVHFQATFDKRRPFASELDKMPEFNTKPYNNHRIHIPNEFPRILKQYTKAAIRTQPKDLLVWSVAYFRCLANGEIPPVKERLEYPIPTTESGLTPGLLRVLNKQLRQRAIIQKPLLEARWRGICLEQATLENLLEQGNLTDDNIPWKRFVAEAAANIALSPTIDSHMEVICEAMSDHPEGISSSLKMPEFVAMFRLVAEKLQIEAESVKSIESYLETVAERQGGILLPQNLRSQDSPAI